MDIRRLMKNIRHIESTKRVHEDVYDSIKKMRMLNEVSNRALEIDQKREEKNFNNYFSDLGVITDFIELEVYPNGIFWGGTIDGVIQYVYKVALNEKDSGYEIYYLDDFNKDNPDNQEISKRIELYFSDFFKFWRDNLLQK